MSVGPATPGLLPAQAERDAVAFLGLLSFLYLTWDPPIRTGAGVNDVTHHAGLNIGAIVVDNIDGEVLGIARNVIHSAESPVEHAEQRVIRAAIQRLHAKRARSETISVEQYYRGSLFYGPGVATRDFIDTGCTLYGSLEPCPMCTATLCVSRMKRTVFVIPDGTYGGSWGASAATPGIKDRYYGRYELQYGVLNIAPDGPLTKRAREVMDMLSARIGTLGVPADSSLRQQGMADTLFLDAMHKELADAFERFRQVKPADLLTSGNDRDRNARTLRDLQRACNIVTQ